MPQVDAVPAAVTHSATPRQGGTKVAAPLPIVLVPGLLTSPRLFGEQLPALWRHGPVTIADNTRDDTSGRPTPRR
jgi:hypothetical protein